MSSDAQLEEMSALFAAFLPTQIADRFSELLSHQPRRWKKIDPWRVWQHISHPHVVEWEKSVNDLFEGGPFARHANAEVTVLRCGHDMPRLERVSLKSALIGVTDRHKGATDDRRNGATWSGSKQAFRTVRRMG